jgi:prophage antirepressor-like protein/predicted GIY-YIG superfamily endonuclease
MIESSSEPEKPQFELLKFSYTDDYPLRVVVIDEEPWFVAIDACRAVDCRLTVGVFSWNDEDERVRLNKRRLCGDSDFLDDTGSRTDLWLVSETGLYSILFHDMTRKSAFNRWVVKEMMPTLRSMRTCSVARSELPVVKERVKINPRPKREHEPHTLYRFFDRNGRLLYVGITHNPAARLKAHSATQAWWKRVAEVRMESYPSRDAVLEAESQAIRGENPRFNKLGKVAS